MLKMYSRYKHDFELENYLDFLSKIRNLDLHLQKLDLYHTTSLLGDMKI